MFREAWNEFQRTVEGVLVHVSDLHESLLTEQPTLECPTETSSASHKQMRPLAASPTRNSEQKSRAMADILRSVTRNNKRIARVMQKIAYRDSGPSAFAPGEQEL